MAHSCLAWGVHQGDPLGPLLFTLALQPLLTSIKDQVSEQALNAWFLDDGIIMGSRAALSKVLDIIKLEGPPRGFHLRSEKLSVWCGSHTTANINPLICDIPGAQEEGFELLGAPVGSFLNFKEILEIDISQL
jgi:hypothetical protein